MIHAGQLTKKITIQNSISVIDSFGQDIPTWTTVATPYAKVDFLNGKEFFQAQQVNSEVTIKIKTRYRDGINTKTRILYGAKILNIVQIIPDEKNTELVFMCKEVV